MANNPICPYCGKEVHKASVDCVKNEIEGLGLRRYYHIDCHKLAQDKPKNEWPYNCKKAETKEGEIKLYTDIIYDYMLKEQKVLPNYKKIYSQLENFYKKRPALKPKGCFLTIKYHYEIKNKNQREDKSEGGIGIVPFLYDEAKIYWEDKAEHDSTIIAKIEKQIEELRAHKKTEWERVQRQKVKKKMPSIAEIMEMEEEKE